MSKEIIPLNVAELDNILAMYRKYDSDNPFFSFNAETRGVIDHLEQMREQLRSDVKKITGT